MFNQIFNKYVEKRKSFNDFCDENLTIKFLLPNPSLKHFLFFYTQNFFKTKDIHKFKNKFHYVINHKPKKPMYFNTLIDFTAYFELMFSDECYNPNMLVKYLTQRGYDGLIINNDIIFNCNLTNVHLFKKLSDVKNYYDNSIL
jgi:hypothetical protein